MKPWLVPALLLSTAGCASTPSGSTRTDAPSAGLNALTANSSSDLTLRPVPTFSEDERSALARQAAIDLEAALAERQTDQPTKQPRSPEEAPQVRAADAGILDAALRAWEQPTPPPESNPPAPASPEDPGVALARRMAEALRRPESQRPPDALALGAIESLLPGALAELDTPGGVLNASLSPEDLRALREARERVLASPTSAGESLVRALAGRAMPLRIVRGLLCRRVEGFGRYNAFESPRFIAGKPLRVIVYTELENFAPRPAREGDPVQPGVSLSEQFTVDLTQSLTLYHDPSGLQAWHKPAQRVLETTRGRRRDFFLVHTIDLPATLTIGRYFLKVTVTDKTSGSSDEVNLPIEIVAK
jgi:hypothetical protein